MINTLKAIILLLPLVSLISCGGDNIDTSKNETPKTLEFNLTGNDKMQFNLKAMVAKEGDLIKVHFENVGRMPKETMGHNFIVLKSGVDLAAFAAKAMTAKDTDYIPVDEKDKIIVASKLLGPGEKDIIEFTAPAKGTYKFICSFPGHYTIMQGNLIVR